MKQAASESLATVAAKVAPPVTVVTAAAAGVNWQEIVWQLTALYLVVMTAKALWDWFKPHLGPKQ